MILLFMKNNLSLKSEPWRKNTHNLNLFPKLPLTPNNIETNERNPYHK